MSAADKLLGLELENGWKVIKHIGRNPSGTGGTFSQGYVVERADKIGFLKAFDFWPAFQSGVDTAAMIQALTSAYNYERDVLAHCGNKRLSKVVLAIDSGKVQIAGMSAMDGTVFYLIFEMAASDVRVQMSMATANDTLWCMRALRDVTLGLYQVHQEMIAHQDAKPSNVLSYPGSVFKIADFGRSSRKGFASPHDQANIAGDQAYAPPELLYGHLEPDFAARRFGCDAYMLGNLAVFLFTGVNITGLLVSHLDPQHHHYNWSGGYKRVLPYLRNSFTRALEDIKPLIDSRVRSEILELIKELCDPDINRRGHPKGVGKHDQYSLQRYVSQLTLLTRRLEIKIRVEARVA